MEIITIAVICFAIYWVGYVMGKTAPISTTVRRDFIIRCEGRRYDVSETDFRRIVTKKVYTRGSLPEGLWQALRAGNYEVTDWISTIRNGTK